MRVASLVLMLWMGCAVGAYAGQKQKATQATTKAAAPAVYPATDILRVFTRLESRLESGISYRDYGPSVSEAYADLKQWVIDGQGNANTAVIEELASAWGNWTRAETIWEHSITRGDKFIVDKSYVQLVQQTCPDVDVDRSHYANGAPSIYISDVLSCFWNKASAHIERARVLAQK